MGQPRLTLNGRILLLLGLFILILRYFPKDSNISQKVKIVLWVSPNHPPRTEERLGRLKSVAKSMNHGENSICRNKFPSTYHIPKGKSCEFLLDSGDHLTDADAIVIWMFNDGYKISELPSQVNRSSHQLWVMYNLEAPPLSFWRNPLQNVINWTMTYRQDSNVVAPYGYKTPLETSTKDIYLNGVLLQDFIYMKTKFAVGVISNCHCASKRDQLISKMKLSAKDANDVQIFGKCGQPFSCGRYDTDCSKSWRNLAAEYKFYLAFENAICKDYVTEKFWRSLDIGMVPVVLGGANYQAIAPPNSFIDVRKFKNVDLLMEYLYVVASNYSLYETYFQWRKSYKVLSDGPQWCSLCNEVLSHKYGAVSKQNVYNDVNWWWQHNNSIGDPACLKNPVYD